MKISEQWFEQDGKVIQKQTHDFTPTMQLNQQLRNADAQGFSDNKLVGVVDTGMIGMWAKEAGVRGSDPDYWNKMKAIIKSKLLDGDFKKLRVWEGSY